MPKQPSCGGRAAVARSRLSSVDSSTRWDATYASDTATPASSSVVEPVETSYPLHDRYSSASGPVSTSP